MALKTPRDSTQVCSAQSPRSCARAVLSLQSSPLHDGVVHSVHSVTASARGRFSIPLAVDHTIWRASSCPAKPKPRTPLLLTHQQLLASKWRQRACSESRFWQSFLAAKSRPFAVLGEHPPVPDFFCTRCVPPLPPGSGIGVQGVNCATARLPCSSPTYREEKAALPARVSTCLLGETVTTQL